MTHDRHAYGPLVRALREARRLTLVELGRAAGLSAGYLSRVERGVEKTASFEATCAIAAALRVLPIELTGQYPPYRALRTVLYLETPPEDFAASVGLTAEEFRDIERGSLVPDPDTVARIAGRLGVPMEALARRADRSPS